MQNQLKMIFVKAGINLVTLIASKVLPRAQATYPQTRILGQVFQRLAAVYQVEWYSTRTRGLEDHNFQRLLDVTGRALGFLGEEDRYYRQWLGLFFLLIEEELAREREATTRDEFVALMRDQWQLSGWRVLSDALYQRRRDELFPLLLTDHLHTLA